MMLVISCIIISVLHLVLVLVAIQTLWRDGKWLDKGYYPFNRNLYHTAFTLKTYGVIGRLLLGFVVSDFVVGGILGNSTILIITCWAFIMWLVYYTEGMNLGDEFIFAKDNGKGKEME